MAAKLAKPKKRKESAGKQITKNLLEYMSVVWAMVLVVALPLYMKEGYYQIGVAKYDAYAHIAVFGLPILLLLVGIYLVCAYKENRMNSNEGKTRRKNLSLTDWFMLVYIVTVCIAFFASGSLKEAFWGYEGWYMGLFSQITFVLVYFIISRFLKDYPIVLGTLCLTASYVFVQGILHRMNIDTIGVYENLSDYYKSQFLSTLGQASWYSSFMTTVLPIGMFAYWHYKNVILRVLSAVFMFLGFMTLVTQNTDSAYMGFAAAMLVLLHVSAKDAGRLRRWFEIALLFVVAPKCMAGLLHIHPNPAMEWDAISALLMEDVRIWILAVFCIVMVVLIAWAERKNKYPVKAALITRNVIYIGMGALVLLWIVVLIASAHGCLPNFISNIGEKIPYLEWNHEWGNGRGFTWSVTAKMFSEMNFKNKLIGVGPDCYALYAHGNYADLIATQWGGAVLTNAHNEWFNMFINGGVLGGVTYLGIFISALVRFVKCSENCPMLVGFAACIAAYMAHNIFCYQQILCTPFVILFMALGEYQIRKKEES